MKSLTTKNFTKSINKDEIVLIDFSATWCMPCRMLAPILDKVDETLKGTVSIYNVDIDECEEIASKYKVYSVPTLMCFKNGEKLGSLVGLNTYEKIVEFIYKMSNLEEEQL